MRVTTFSRQFPAYHPKAGTPTHFVEKIWHSLGVSDLINKYGSIRYMLYALNPDKEAAFIDQFADNKDRISCIHEWNAVVPKHHTIRKGKSKKVGDKFSPRVWSGAPYNSKQIVIAPDIEIVKVWNLDIDIVINGPFAQPAIKLDGKMVGEVTQNMLAANDGLTSEDMYEWFKPSFKKGFSGQVICWNKDVDYPLTLVTPTICYKQQHASMNC